MADWDEDARARLRAAAHRRDGDAGLAALAGRPLGPVLQYAGDVLLAALDRGLPAAEPLARKCVEELDGRDGPGDAELAAELTAALEGRATGLIGVPVDLGALGARLEADPADGVQAVDLRTGDIDEPGPGFDPESRLTFVPGGPDPGDPGEEAQRGRARRRLAEHGYRPGPRPFL
ncbi:hypothetical protein GCM10010191_39460 [Actinomadura vinacea]|uniref:Uncharacterized protein n=1 Tax=Actinomadura vinacea TaxID=115336 RepID=A0ABN3J6X1_9ACTN